MVCQVVRMTHFVTFCQYAREIHYLFIEIWILLRANSRKTYTFASQKKKKYCDNWAQLKHDLDKTKWAIR